GLQVDLLYGPGTVIYPKVTFKRQFVFSAWVINNVVAPFIVAIGAIAEHIVVNVNPRAGKRAGKRLVEEFQIIIINVIFAVKVLYEGNKALVIFKTRVLVSLQHFLLAAKGIVAIYL